MSNATETKMEFRKIGTVEIMRDRVYQLDPQNHMPGGTEVYVSPGKFDVISDGYTTLWLMTGVINGARFRMGDGMFTMNSGDMPTNIEVTFPSRSFGPDEWEEMLTDPQAQEGPGQRLRFVLPGTDAKGG